MQAPELEPQPAARQPVVREREVAAESRRERAESAALEESAERAAAEARELPEPRLVVQALERAAREAQQPGRRPSARRPPIRWPARSGGPSARPARVEIARC